MKLSHAFAKKLNKMVFLTFFVLITTVLIAATWIGIHQREIISEERNINIAETISSIIKSLHSPLTSVHKYVASGDARILISFSEKPKTSTVLPVTTTRAQLKDWLKNQYDESYSFSFQGYSIRAKAKIWINFNVTKLKHYLSIRYSIAIMIMIAVIMIVIVLVFTFSTLRYHALMEHLNTVALTYGLKSNPIKASLFAPKLYHQVRTAISQMFKRIRKLTNEKQLTIDSLSHDINTSLMKIKLLLDNSDHPHQEKINSQIEFISYMLYETRQFSNEGKSQEKVVKFDLVSLLQSICDDYSATGEEITFYCKEKEIHIQGQMNNLRRAFTNLTENARLHGSSARVSIETKNCDVIIKISDDGPGIAPTLINKVFQPYVRAKNLQNTLGSGLGLTITKQILTQHNATIALQNREPQGLDIEIKFKLAD